MNKKYVFVEEKEGVNAKDSEGNQAIMICDEESDYFGIVYCYGTVSLHFPENENENEENIEHTIEFTFKILSEDQEHLKNDEEFKSYIGDILVEIIIKNTENPEA